MEGNKYDQANMKDPQEIELLRQIFDNAQVAIFITDVNYKINRINAEFTRVFGYSADEAIGKDVRQLIVPEEVSYESEEIKKQLEKGERVEYETIRRKKGGQIIHVLCRVTPIIMNKENVGAFGIYSDISESKKTAEELKKAHEELEMRVAQRTEELKRVNAKLEKEILERKRMEEALRESEERYRIAIDHSNDGVSILKGTHQLYVNQRYAEIHGYVHPGEVIGKSLEDLVHPDDIQRVKRNALRRQRGKKAPNRYEFKAIRKDGSVIDIEISVTHTIYRGEPVSLSYLRDISERKKAEKELLQAKEEAQAANTAKSDFLANMSHEIRTPLNGVMGVLNLLFSTDPNDAQLDLIETGKRSSESLLTLINDILDFSKIEARELDLEILDFNLRNAIEEVVELPAMLAHEKALEFAYEIHDKVPSLLRGDPGRLRQVLLNLTNNAIKFTNEGEVVVRISLDHETKTHAKIRFDVKDTGVGIPEDKLEIIFESFKQTDSSISRMYGGSGLGLSISKKLVELMGGEIYVNSEMGKGSAFTFTALFEKQPQTETTMWAPPPNIIEKRFLLVDDNKTNLDILRGYMEAWGFSCDVASSGEMALTLMNAVAKANAPYEVLIVDRRMPGMDGIELGKRIKNDHQLKDTTLIMLTSQGLRGEITEIKNIGFAAYLTKPIRRSHLFNCLVNTLGKKQERALYPKHPSPLNHSTLDKKNRQIRVLIVEDNIINLKLAKRMIEKWGFQADSAANGMEALRALENFKYHVVLMDVQMPEMDGLEATRQIRNASSKVINHNIPVIAMTAHAMRGDRERCLEAGMNDYITKPIDMQDMIETIEKYIS